MTAKTVSIGLKPTSVKKPGSQSGDQPGDEWVANRAAAGEPEAMKRLTIDIPVSLHRAIKAQCAMRDKKIADEVRELLLAKYGNTEGNIS